MALKNPKAAGAPAEDPGPTSAVPSRVNEATLASRERWLAPAYGVSLVLLFVGERILPSYDWARWLFSGVGVLGLVAATAARFVLAGQHDGERRTVESTLAKFSAGGLLAVAIYFATTDTGKSLLGIAAAAPATRARIEGAALVVWIVLLALSVVPLFFGERAMAPMRGAERIEARRVRAATIAGVTLACALVYSTLFTYAAGTLDKKVDFSYFRTARPSESTKNIAQSLTEPVKVMAFFPQLNDVGIEVDGYLGELRQAAGPNMTIETHDRLLVPAIAKEARVTQDGTLLLTRGTSRETLTIGAEMKTAAAKLKTLDGDFQKALLKVMRSQRIAYFTVGHGEINEANAGAPGANEGRAAKALKKVLEQQNYTVKDLGLAQGLANEVPKDAHVVVMLGPSQAPLPEEVASLAKYADRGGKLLLALDPEAKVDLDPLASVVDLTWAPAILATDDARHFYPRRRNPSDRAILITNRFSSHASVTTLSRNSARAAVVFPSASSLDKKAGTDAKVDFTVKAFGDAWNDVDGDFEFDQGSEKRTVYNLAAAVSRPPRAPAEPDKAAKKDAPPEETRAFVIADVDALSDAALANEPNLIMAVDALRWLGGEESFIGAVTSTEDVRIEHTKQKDIVWFYGLIFAAPALVLGIGLLYTRRKRPTRTSPPAAGDAPTPEKGSGAAAKKKKAGAPAKAPPEDIDPTPRDRPVDDEDSDRPEGVARAAAKAPVAPKKDADADDDETEEGRPA